MSKTDVMLARAATRLRDVPGYVAYDLRRFTELTGTDPAEQFGVGRTALTRLALCGSPRRDHRWAFDVQQIADACDVDPATLANVVRTVDVLTDWMGAAASQSPYATDEGDEPQHSPIVDSRITAKPRLLAAARDTGEERTVAELPPTGMIGLPRWLARAVETFWGEHEPPDEFPRDLELPLLTGLPVALVELPGLSVGGLADWLAKRHLPRLGPVADRRLRACLLAYAGVGAIFVDASDTPAQRRVSLGHEGGHFIVDYLLPRQEAARRRPGLLEVLDGLREPTTEERIDAAAFDVPIGVHTHLLERTPDGAWRDLQGVHTEHHAERVAMELLAPQQVVLQRAQQAGLDSIEELAALLEADFGLPSATAARYAGQLTRLRPPRPQGLLGMLDLHAPDATADQPSEGPDEDTSGSGEGPNRPA